MLRRQLVTGSLMIVVTALFHVACLVGLVSLLAWVGHLAALPETINTFLVFGLAVLCIIAIHGIEAYFWALFYKATGQFDDIATAMYFSVGTTTTLGYGDFTLSGRWRILASFQAVGGLIMFGASTAFLFEIIRRLFPAA